MLLVTIIWVSSSLVFKQNNYRFWSQALANFAIVLILSCKFVANVHLANIGCNSLFFKRENDFITQKEPRGPSVDKLFRRNRFKQPLVAKA